MKESSSFSLRVGWGDGPEDEKEEIVRLDMVSVEKMRKREIVVREYEG